MPRREDLKSVLVIGSGPIVIGQGCEFDYSGTQACRVLQAGGHPGQPGQLQPGDDHDRPGVRRRHLRRADHPRGAGQGDREGAPGRRCCPRSAARPRSTPPSPCTRSGTLKKYDVELIGADIDAIEACEDRERFKEIVTGLGAEVPQHRDLPHHRRVPRRRLRHPVPTAGPRTGSGLGFPSSSGRRFTLGGLGSGIAYNEDDLRRIAGSGPGRQPHDRGAPRGVDHRLEGVRARADARPPRQRRDRLLDRERRPDGRAHRRLGDRRPRDDAHRPRVPAHARHRDQDHPRGRRGHRRLQHPVRGRPEDRPDGRHRDEPARVPELARSPPRPPASRSPRSPPGSRSATPSTRSPTTSPARPRRPSSPPSTTWSSRSRGSRSRSSPAPTPRSPPT